MDEERVSVSEQAARLVRLLRDSNPPNLLAHDRAATELYTLLSTSSEAIAYEQLVELSKLPDAFFSYTFYSDDRFLHLACGTQTSRTGSKHFPA